MENIMENIYSDDFVCLDDSVLDEIGGGPIFIPLIPVITIAVGAFGGAVGLGYTAGVQKWG